MNKTTIFALGLLIAGSASQIAPTFARNVRNAPVASNEVFGNAYDSTGGASRFCSEEPGNPYNPQTDYMAWSAWRAHGAWDSRNDCP